MTRCSYGDSCLGLAVTLENCSKCSLAKLHHICQGEYESKHFQGLELGLSKLCLLCLKKKATDLSTSTNNPPQPKQATDDTSTPQMNDKPISNTPDGERSGSSRVSPTTTARNKKKKSQTSKRCQKGARVKVMRKDLFHVLSTDEQRHSLKGFGNNRNFHGTIVSGSGKQGYKI